MTLKERSGDNSPSNSARPSVFQGLLNERIGFSLDFKRRGRPMATEKASFWGKFHYSANRSLKFSMIGIWKISPANRAADNQITTDQQVFAREIIGDMAGRMAGGVDHAYLHRAELDCLVVRDISISAERRNHKRQTKHASLK